MRYRLQNIVSYSAIIMAICLLSILSLQYLLFELTDYNIYRVLDISLSDLGFVVIVLLLHYILYKGIPHYANLLWREWKPLQRTWFWSVGIIITVFFSSAFWLSSIPFEFTLLFFIGAIVYTIASRYVSRKVFQKAILLILFGASMDASTIFMMHEAQNSGTHLEYAQEIADPRDPFAHAEINSLIEEAKSNNYISERFWREQWTNSDYLSSNYTFDFEKRNTNFISYSKDSIFNLINNESNYSIITSDDSVVSFSLKKDLRLNNYEHNIPYKYIDRLRDFHFALIYEGEIVFSNTDNFDNDIETIPLPSIGAHKKTDWKGFDILVYRNDEGRIVLIGEPLSEAQVWVSNFSLFFTIFLFIGIVAQLFHLFLDGQRVQEFWKKATIEFRISATLTTMTLTLFFVIAGSTFFFLNRNNNQLLSHEQKFLAKYLKRQIGPSIAKDTPISRALLNDSVKRLAEYKNISIDLYDADGSFITGTIEGNYERCIPTVIENRVLERLTSNPFETIHHEVETCNKLHNRTTVSLTNAQEVKGYLSVQYHNSSIGADNDIPIIMSSLLNVYVLLLLLTWGMGVILIRLLTEPLGVLAKRLGTFRLGAANQKLRWSSQDAIGQLISQYNNMVDVVDQSTKELVRKEREDAWQNMAQQIAHEINNPLTPLKLNLQFLIKMIGQEENGELSMKQTIVNNLIEQVDVLAKVASQFKSFAMLDNPNVRPISLNAFVEDYVNHHKGGEETKYVLNVEHHAANLSKIMIDDAHLKTILDHILDFSESNFVDGKSTGSLSIELLNDNGQAVILVKSSGACVMPDSGSGIFGDSFSTTSSSDLGLSICRRIVEYYGGTVEYESISNEGAAFRIAFDIQKRNEVRQNQRITAA